MASLLDFIRGRNLTKPAVVSPSGTEFYDSPQEQALGLIQAQQAPESVYDSAPIPMQDEQGMAAPESPDVQVQQPGVDAKAVTPTFDQVSKDRYGNVTDGTKGLTKLGVLAKILKGGVQGAEDALEGGALDAPRNGESQFGKGFSAARTMPSDSCAEGAAAATRPT
jgi:hypothetical protein